MAEGGDSTRVGGVHIELTLQGAEKVRDDVQQVAAAAKDAAAPVDQLGTTAQDAAYKLEDVGKAAEEAAQDVNKLEDATKKAEESSTGMSERGLAGMLLKVAALRKALTELSETIEVFQQRSGSDEAVHIFSEKGIAGAEQKMREIAEWSSHSSTALQNASEALGKMAHLDISGLVKMFTDPGKFSEEQERLGILIGRRQREDAARAEDEKARKQMERMDEEERRVDEKNRKEIEAQNKKLDDEEAAFEDRMHRENSAQMERDREHAKRLEEAAEKAADKFAERVEAAFDRITDKIQSGVFGVGSAGGDFSQIQDLLERIERVIPRGLSS